MKELLAFALLLCGIAATAAYALAPASVDSLIEDLRDSDAVVRRAAASALAKRGPAAQPAVDALKDALDDQSFAVRVLAGVALMKLGVTDGQVAISPFDSPSLIDALNDRDYNVRDSAREGLQQIGSLAVPGLAKRLEREQDESMRSSILSVLSQIGPESYEAVPAVIKLLAEEDRPSLRYQAISTLAQIGPAAREAVPTLIDLVNKGEVNERRKAVNALGDFGPAASEAISALQDALLDEDDIVARNAELALSKIQVASR